MKDKKLEEPNEFSLTEKGQKIVDYLINDHGDIMRAVASYNRKQDAFIIALNKMIKEKNINKELYAFILNKNMSIHATITMTDNLIEELVEHMNKINVALDIIKKDNPGIEGSIDEMIFSIDKEVEDEINRKFFS